MGTEPSSEETRESRPRRGVAMFVVLGAIVVVTMLGAVGLVMAGKDQDLSGDLADIKSRDQVALAGLQLALNRLSSDPANLVTQLNAFIQDGRSTQRSTLEWLDFTSATLAVKKSEPDWFSLNPSVTEDQSAVKVRILGIAQGDTSASLTMDSAAVFVALQCQARGRHGDVRAVQGVYRIHGVALATQVTVYPVVIPKYAFYVGGSLVNSNLAVNVTGDVYVGGAGGTWINSNIMNITGDFKWNGDLKINAPLLVTGNAYVGGAIMGQGFFQVNGNLGIGNGFLGMNQPIAVGKSLWVGGASGGGAWNAGTNLIVQDDMVLWPSGNIPFTSMVQSLRGSIWLMSGLSIPSGANFVIKAPQGSIYVTDSSTLVPFNFNVSSTSVPSPVNPAPIFAGADFVSIAPSRTSSVPPLKFNSTPVIARRDAYIASDFQNPNISVTGSGYFPNYTGGTTGITRGSAGSSGLHAPYRAAPTLSDLGLASLSKTTVADNLMDHLFVDATHSPDVLSHMQELRAMAWAAGVVPNQNTTMSIPFSPATLNQLYAYMDRSKLTFRGYMILNLNSTTGNIDFLDPAGTGFQGKALFVVDSRWDVNGNAATGTGWPHSNSEDNVQVIDVRGQNGGVLQTWGWSNGNFAGLFYWENPPCDANGYQLQLPQSGTWYGSYMFGSNSSCSHPPALQPNQSSIRLVKSTAVFISIALGLPGVLQASTNPDGSSSSVISTYSANTTTPLLRLSTGTPYFEAKGIYR